MTFRPLALVLLLAASAPAQFIYGLNINGKLSLNGTVLDSLPTAFDPDTNQFAEQRWVGVKISGPDRYALRFDGRVQKNGTKLYQLAPITLGSVQFGWHGFELVGDHVHMLRQDGLRATDGTAVVTYPLTATAQFFPQLVVQVEGSTTNAFALRTDGTIFQGTSTAAAGKLTASGGPPAIPDGQQPVTWWIDAALDDVTDHIVAIRADGQLWKIAIADLLSSSTEVPEGEVVASLPAPLSTGDQVHFYTRVVVSGGEWRVLRADGAIFSSASVLEPLVDHPGNGLDLEAFGALTFDGINLTALRFDGRVYAGIEDGSDPLFNLPGDSYLGLATGTEPPDLTKFKNPKPKASKYTVTVLEGDAVSIPVLVSDIEKTDDDLLVTTDPDKPLPAGATFSEVDDGEGGLIRTIEWDGTQPVGTYQCPLLVTDEAVEHPKPVKFVETIKVIAADIDAEKNKTPKPAKIKAIQALVGQEVKFTVLAADPDDDMLTFSINEAKEPFATLGAAFDEVTREFTWTPTFDEIGKWSVKFFVDDGTKTTSRTVSIKVVNSLIFDSEPPPP